MDNDYSKWIIMSNSGVICTDTCLSDRRKDEILALMLRCAGLQKYESLDTRATYWISAVSEIQGLEP